MVEIYMYLFKALYYITNVFNIISSLHLFTQILQAMLCFNHFYDKKGMLQINLKTVN